MSCVSPFVLAHSPSRPRRRPFTTRNLLGKQINKCQKTNQLLAKPDGKMPPGLHGRRLGTDVEQLYSLQPGEFWMGWSSSGGARQPPGKMERWRDSHDGVYSPVPFRGLRPRVTPARWTRGDPGWGGWTGCTGPVHWSSGPAHCGQVKAGKHSETTPRPSPGRFKESMGAIPPRSISGLWFPSTTLESESVSLHRC